MLVTSICLLFPQCFQKDFFLRVVKSWDCVVKGEEALGYKPSTEFEEKSGNLSRRVENSVGKGKLLITWTYVNTYQESLFVMCNFPIPKEFSRFVLQT